MSGITKWWTQKTTRNTGGWEQGIYLTQTHTNDMDQGKCTEAEHKKTR